MGRRPQPHSRPPSRTTREREPLDTALRPPPPQSSSATFLDQSWPLRGNPWAQPASCGQERAAKPPRSSQNPRSDPPHPPNTTDGSNLLEKQQKRKNEYFLKLWLLERSVCVWGGYCFGASGTYLLSYRSPCDPPGRSSEPTELEVHRRTRVLDLLNASAQNKTTLSLAFWL